MNSKPLCWKQQKQTGTRMQTISLAVAILALIVGGLALHKALGFGGVVDGLIARMVDLASHVVGPK